MPRCTCIQQRSASTAAARTLDSAKNQLSAFYRAQDPKPAPQAAAPIAAPEPIIQTKVAYPPIEDPLLQQFARLIMKDGKLLRSQLHLSLMLRHISTLTHSDPLPLVKRATSEASPVVRIVQQKMGGMKRAALPLPLEEKKRVRVAIKWIEKASMKYAKGEKRFGRRLAIEVLSVLDGTSEVLKRKDEVHKAAVVARWVW